MTMRKKSTRTATDTGLLIVALVVAKHCVLQPRS